MSCRCKRATPETHLCHGGGYTCPNPGRRRFYNFRAAALAGSQLKFDATDTFACDECWAAFQIRLAEPQPKTDEPEVGPKAGN